MSIQFQHSNWVDLRYKQPFGTWTSPAYITYNRVYKAKFALEIAFWTKVLIAEIAYEEATYNPRVLYLSLYSQAFSWL